MMYDDGYIPSPSYQRINDIQPVASFIANKIIVSKNTLSTSNDVEEKIATIATMVMCESALSLLILAFLTEDNSFVEQAKQIYRGI